MLRIWMGRANTGKSRRVLEEIRDNKREAMQIGRASYRERVFCWV